MKRHCWEPADEATQKRISPWDRGEVHCCKDCGCIRHAKAFRSAYFVGETCVWSAPPCGAAEQHYEIVIRLGNEEHVIPARADGIDGVMWVLRYGENLNSMTSGSEGLNTPEHALTRAALNEVDRLLRISTVAATCGLPRRPLTLGETLTIQIRTAAQAGK